MTLFSRIGLGLTLILAAMSFDGRANAAPITHHDKTNVDKPDVSTWSGYLAGGPSVWRKVPHPLVTQAVRDEIWHALKTDPGGTAPMVKFLLWKQSIDPARFDYYHPSLVRPLARIAASIPATSTPTVAAQVLTAPTSTPNTSTTSSPSIPPTEGQTIGSPAQSVPEPGTLMIAISLATWAVCHQRRTR
jgi:hypothetical protein